MYDTLELPEIHIAPIVRHPAIGITPKQIDELYGLMVAHLGAPECPEGRANFKAAYTASTTPGEYRIGRRLGINGRLAYDGTTLSVIMPPEHRTPGRVAIAQQADAALAAFMARVRA